jgi:hypothetical protein
MATATTRTFALPKLDLTRFEMPKFGMPKFEMPKFEMPRAQLPHLAMPRIEQDVVAVVRDAAYATIGLGVLAAQQAQRGVAAVSGQLRRTAK